MKRSTISKQYFGYTTDRAKNEHPQHLHAKNPPLFGVIWELLINIYIADILIGVIRSYYINV